MRFHPLGPGYQFEQLTLPPGVGFLNIWATQESARDDITLPDRDIITPLLGLVSYTASRTIDYEEYVEQWSAVSSRIPVAVGFFPEGHGPQDYSGIMGSPDQVLALGLTPFPAMIADVSYMSTSPALRVTLDVDGVMTIAHNGIFDGHVPPQEDDFYAETFFYALGPMIEPGMYYLTESPIPGGNNVRVNVRVNGEVVPVVSLVALDADPVEWIHPPGGY